MMRATRLEVNLDALSGNLAALRAFLARREKPPLVAAVLKANAYGMGAVEVARELAASGIDMLAVACLPEALELERAIDKGPAIFVMGHTPDEYLGIAAEHDLTLSIFDERQAGILSQEGLRRGRRIRVHLKVDTGLNRLGLKPGRGAAELVARIAALRGLDCEGIFTHLALRDEASDALQFAHFTTLVDEAAALGARFRLRHVCDSIGLARYPEYWLDLVRPGAVLYGLRPMNAPLLNRTPLRTPYALRSRVSRIRELTEGEAVGYDDSYVAPRGGARLATLPIGYGDGYPRCLSNKSEVLIRGQRAPVVGLINMDQLTFDVSLIPDAVEGDEVLLLGSTSGNGESGIEALELADLAGTNRNEIVTAISRRVPRVYTKGGRIVGERDYLLDGNE
ncbi:MAG: alanine racemase [Spirochaetota bacterium]